MTFLPARAVIAALMLLPLVTACDFSGSAPLPGSKNYSPFAQGTEAKEPVPAWVSDQADIIPPANEERLTQSLSGFEKRTGHQLIVVTVPSLEGKSVEDYSIALARQWKVGRKDHDDGALIVVAPNERKIRIELGVGLECYISDGQTKAIIDREMIPRFKVNDMERGIEAGAASMIALMDAMPKDTRAAAAAVKSRSDTNPYPCRTIPKPA